jgi:hypothetical protein
MIGYVDRKTYKSHVHLLVREKEDLRAALELLEAQAVQDGRYVTALNAEVNRLKSEIERLRELVPENERYPVDAA